MPCTAHFSLHKERLFSQAIETESVDEALVIAHRTTEAFAAAFNEGKNRYNRIKPGELEVWVHLHGPWDLRVACAECGRKMEPEEAVRVDGKNYHPRCAVAEEARHAVV